MPATFNNLINAILACTGAAAAKPLVDELTKKLCTITGVDLHPEFFMDKEASITAQGKAVSSITAAQCAEDIERTRVFLQGIRQAINDKLVQKKQHGPVEILYAGTGPFGLLLIPLLPFFNPESVSVTLLDIHRDSVDKLQQLIQYLGVNDFIRESHCIDACEWSTSNRFDLIISETMKHGLVQEPQVSVFAHLHQFLLSDGVLIPEQIHLDLWLARAGQLRSSDASAGDLLIGKLFQLDAVTAGQIGKGDFSCLANRYIIPEYPHDACDLKLTTFIRVYRQHQLVEHQSQLTIPLYEKNARPIPNSELLFHYELGRYPHCVFNYQKLPSPEELPLPDSLDKCSQGIYHLKRLWHKAQQQKKAQALHSELQQQEWLLDKMVLDKLGVGLEPAIEQLFQANTFARFERWLVAASGGNIASTVVDSVNQVVTEFLSRHSAVVQKEYFVLTQEQRDFWAHHGYLVVPGVLNARETENARNAIWQFLDMHENDPDSWYKNNVNIKKIMVQMFSHPALDVARTSSKIHAIFKQLWGRENLIVSCDRVGFNPPETTHWRFPGPDMHWDLELKTPIPFGTQGLIYLSDTAENQGAFSCVPGFHQHIDQWLDNLPDNVDPAIQDWSNWQVKPIAAKAGDLIVWHHALPHGSSPNRAGSPRLVQYINMYI